MSAVDLRTPFGKLELANPIVAAAGTFGYAREFDELMPVAALGGLVTKGISRAPRKGNPAPRVCDTASGMINSIGLENVGVDAFIADKLPYLGELRAGGVAVVVNFFGEQFEDYVAVADGLTRAAAGRISALEMNISCPNTKRGGVEFGTEPATAGELVAAVRAVTDLPLWVKLTPNITDVVGLARACVDAGADALCLINTVRAMAIDPRRRRPRIATTFGGLSGPAIKPIALRMVYQVAQAKLGVPICGLGGIRSGEDAAEFLVAGATCVQVGTQSFAEPTAAIRIRDELAAFCRSERVSSSRELVGTLQV